MVYNNPTRLFLETQCVFFSPPEKINTFPDLQQKFVLDL